MVCVIKIAIGQSESFYGFLFRLSGPLIEPINFILPQKCMYVKPGYFHWFLFFSRITFNSKKDSSFKGEADLRDKITNLFNGIYISIYLAT